MKIQSIYLKTGPNWPNQQCCSSKTAPRILIFSIAIGNDYSHEVKNSEIQAPAFFKHNNSFIATLISYAWKSFDMMCFSNFFLALLPTIVHCTACGVDMLCKLLLDSGLHYQSTLEVISLGYSILNCRNIRCRYFKLKCCIDITSKHHLFLILLAYISNYGDV